MESALERIEKYVQQFFLGLEPFDVSWNGLQVENDGKVERIYAGVDSTFDFLQAAEIPKNALFLVHHGLFWKSMDPRICGINAKKVQFCMKNNAALMAYHLPLDLHPVIGNNSRLLQKLGFSSFPLSSFGWKDGVEYGFLGQSDKKIQILDLFAYSQKHFSKDSLLFNYGKKMIKTCAVISGSGGFGIHEAWEKKIDLFVTGEYSHSAYTFARDLQINLLCLTHYGSEKEGVISLGEEIAKKFEKEFTFLDILPIF